MIVLFIIIVVVLLFCLMAFFGAPYLPSNNAEIRKAFRNLYKISGKDLLIDLGSGDGRVLKIASDFGAKSVGIELNPILALFSNLRLRKNKNAKTICKNYNSYDFPADATVVYVFGDSRDIEKIVSYIEKQATKIGHPLYLISHAFTTEKYKPEKKYRAYYLYKIKGEDEK